MVSGPVGAALVRRAVQVAPGGARKARRAVVLAVRAGVAAPAEPRMAAGGTRAR